MKEIELLKKKLEREKLARKQAEIILESKALELYNANESLKRLNENLEFEIEERTKALQESEIKYRNVIDQATDIIYSTDEEGYFTFINPIGCRAFGYSQEEILGRRYIDFVPDEYKEKLFTYYTKIKEEKKTSDYFEFPIRSKSGQLHWIGQNVNRIVDQNGFPYYNAVARDITLRKSAERELEVAQQALVSSEHKYRSVLENMELGLMEVDLNGRIMVVYDRFCEMTGYSKEELLGKDAIETVLAPEFKTVLVEQDKNRKQGQSGVYEVQLKRKDGKRIWVLISGAPFYNENGEVIGSLGIHYDISDRKELARNLEIARAKAVRAQQAEQNFLANMSHEIRTPLNAIIGMTHLLLDSELDGKQREYIDILDTSASLLKGLVSDILDISKIDSGMAEINLSTFDLRELALRLIKTFKIRSQEKSLVLQSLIVESGNTVIESDRQWLNQILINLISNAVKFTPEGSVQLSIKRTNQDPNYATYYFEVSDTGIGMTEAEMDSIFTEFKQANSAVRKDYGGSGLGLSIASRLVNLLGGELEVESQLGVGSKFYFTLTFSLGEKSLVKGNQISDLTFEFSSNTKILIVEDNFMNQRYIASLLDKWNLKYTIVDNGKEAVDIFQIKHFDLIFMDLSMPIMDGYEATQIIRKNEKQIPIIALTASTFLSKRELALKVGMSDFLAKPFTPEDLSQILRKHLSKKIEVALEKKGEFSFSSHLDVEVLESMYGDDLEYALEMFSTFLEVIEDQLEILVDCNRNRNAKEIRLQVHKMKPMFSMVGLSEISAKCEKLENELERKSYENMDKATDEIIKNIKDSLHLVKNEYNSLANALDE